MIRSTELNFGRVLRNAERFGPNEAVVDLERDVRHTYSEHLGRVGALASALRALGLDPSDRLAVLTDASHVYIELWRACCGGAAVINPINTRLAEPEILEILLDSESSAIVVGPDFADMIAKLRPRLPALRHVILDDGSTDGIDCPHEVALSSLIETAPSAALPTERQEDAPAVLMYTGGTTGRAKGVVLSQRAITLSCYRMQPVVDIGGQQSYLSFMPMFHVGASSSWSFYLPSGGRTVVLPRFDPASVNHAIADHEITAIGAVPTMLAMMLTHDDFRPEMIQSLELIVYGGSPMPPALLQQLRSVAPKVGLHQAYGMTEVCGVATALTPSDHERGDETIRSVGRPALGISLALRDPSSRLATPSGEIGEIWLRSDSVMTEYWKQPGVTTDSIVDGWYRTGDAGRLDDAGYLHLADRVKDMIVTGGENVYSLEVENVINTHPAVDQVAVIGLPDSVWGEQVHAVVVTSDPALSEDVLDRHARQDLAGYKVPKSWTVQNEPLPLSAAGKVLKNELRSTVNTADS